jgi:acyl-coenzyme A thioesterase PaaI-like protein
VSSIRQPRAEIALPERFEGWQGIAHGGIVATILDEVMAWALVHHDVWGVTARMSIEFRRPIRVGQGIRAEGRLTSRKRRVFETAALIVDRATGQELATATGVYVSAPEERKQELKERYGFRVVEAVEMAPG